jgi:hypothetical protein
MEKPAEPSGPPPPPPRLSPGMKLSPENQRHILGDKRPGTTACPGLLGVGDKLGEKVCGEETNILYWTD